MLARQGSTVLGRVVTGIAVPALLLTMGSTPVLAAPPGAGEPASAPATEASPSPTTALPDSSLQALVGKDVTVEGQGSVVSGNLAAFDGASLTVIDAAGQVVLVPRDAVIGIKVATVSQPAPEPAPAPATAPAPAPPPQPAPVPVPPKSTKGAGLIITGAVLLPLGGLILIVSTAVGGFVFEFDEPANWAPAAGVGGAMLITGIPLLIAGSVVRNKANASPTAFRDPRRRLVLSPMLGKDRVGGGVGLRF